ncbi:exodeoxyribonuclease V subunit beta [Arsenophonus endosymbiont of Lipoptena cervi]|uniref:exodeoxyribonuclease V subunit beta n=1 Tax=Arsenophonus endosymbiont of Lipoptena cervi TaxID=363258 RepID=UPI00376ECA5D
MKNRNLEFFQLDPYDFPLNGERLIEASAGTGKTYTIVLLYLRLLLGVGQQNSFFRPLTVEEILVVTFTEASTKELRSRIFHNIHQMRIACIRNGIGFESTSIYLKLLPFILDKELAIQLLLDAERKIDKAAIYTIHGFCKRVLMHNAFESGMLFEPYIIKDENILQQQACIDFWRCNYYLLDYSLSKFINNEWSSPTALLNEIKPYLQGDIPIFIHHSIQYQSIQQCYKHFINMIEIVKNLWILNSDIILDLISNSAVNKHTYNKRNLDTWFININKWARSVTLDYKNPKELYRFSQSYLIKQTLTDNVPEHEVFLAIDNLLEKSSILRNFFIFKAIIDIRQIIIKKKQLYGAIGFDDLLNNLDQALHASNGEKLANIIRNRYPFVMIDEFQDTNSRQYKIFNRIYHGYNKCGIVFIGDPKQAIYGFRGADIFAYLKAKKNIKFHYTLDINWRSSANMISAVNQLFNLVKNPFIFEQIPFHKICSSIFNKDLAFIYKTKKLSALNFFYLDKSTVSILEYQQIMAAKCASEICNWLQDSKNGTTWLYRDAIKKSVKATDIMVLVRTRYEGTMIENALSKCNIPSVFLSKQESVFSTNEANDLLLLLQGILSPEKDLTLRCALATSLIGLSAEDLEKLNSDENQLAIFIEEFANYLLLWQTHGIASVLRAIMVNHKIAENLVMDNIDGEKRLINFMHLGELLQEAELQLNNEYALVNWLSRQIKQPNPKLENQQIRLKNDEDIVSISTIHKSKGLEYPIVCLPFACQFSEQKSISFHDRENFQMYVDLTKQSENIKSSSEECLSEDLRLLYVALTRSIYHCSIGIAPLIKRNRSKKKVNTDVHKSALGYLLQQGKAGNADLLRDALNSLINENINVIPFDGINLYPWYHQKNKSYDLLAKNFTGYIQKNWRVTSYSGLIYNEKYPLSDHLAVNNVINIDSINIKIDIQYLMPKINNESLDDDFVVQSKIQEKSIHTFPRGPKAGTFLHSILSLSSFNQYPKEDWLAEKLEQSGFSTDWVDVLKIWLINIFNAPILQNNFSLSKITSKYKVNEMEFHLPIEKLLHPSALDRLTHQYDYLSKLCSPFNFEPVIGILNGFIDLVFIWQDRFYLLDYKSNWLGKKSQSYSPDNIQKVMVKSRYDLQYQLYTLALNRYLENRIPNYNYQKHFGGIIYFFLRGIDVNNPNYGIYHTIPSYELIQKLDDLFSSIN